MPRDRSIRNNVGSRSPSKCPSIDRSLVTAPGSTTVFATCKQCHVRLGTLFLPNQSLGFGNLLAKAGL